MIVEWALVDLTLFTVSLYPCSAANTWAVGGGGGQVCPPVAPGLCQADLEKVSEPANYVHRKYFDIHSLTENIG